MPTRPGASGPERIFVILEGLGTMSFFGEFSIGDKSADKWLKIRPWSPRGSLGNTRLQNANAGLVPRTGVRGKVNLPPGVRRSERSEVLKKRKKEERSTRSTRWVGGFSGPTPGGKDNGIYKLDPTGRRIYGAPWGHNT